MNFPKQILMTIVVLLTINLNAKAGEGSIKCSAVEKNLHFDSNALSKRPELERYGFSRPQLVSLYLDQKTGISSFEVFRYEKNKKNFFMASDLFLEAVDEDIELQNKFDNKGLQTAFDNAGTSGTDYDQVGAYISPIGPRKYTTKSRYKSFFQQKTRLIYFSKVEVNGSKYKSKILHSLDLTMKCEFEGPGSHDGEI